MLRIGDSYYQGDFFVLVEPQLKKAVSLKLMLLKCTKKWFICYLLMHIVWAMIICCIILMCNHKNSIILIAFNRHKHAYKFSLILKNVFFCLKITRKTKLKCIFFFVNVYSKLFQFLRTATATRHAAPHPHEHRYYGRAHEIYRVKLSVN